MRTPPHQYPRLSKFALQLPAWAGLVANGGLTALVHRLPPDPHCPLDGAQAHLDALVLEQLLADHLGIAVVLFELLL